ncbi:hypothetical protein SRS16CHR_01389 [Variovorax sp. SRS16]|nr:hypothetical protein SRS16CHR_01389 [Variovorax sp. SRS16]
MFTHFFTFWRKPRPVPPPAPRSPAPLPDAVARMPAVARLSRPSARGDGLRVEYHAGLVDELRAEHEGLLVLYDAIGRAMGQNRWPEVSAQLRKLRGMLTSHLLKERVSLYCYLQRVIPEDDDMHALFLGFKIEMGAIGKIAFNFVDRHAASEVFDDPARQAAFREQYASIGQVLTDRIVREEAQLYPMYQARSSA